MYRFQKVFQKIISSKCRQRPKCIHSLPQDIFRISEEVAQSLLSNKPVVALESTVITHGLPYPDNLECALRLEEIVRENNAVPATIGILKGVINIGMDSQNLEMLASSKSAVKVSRRDLPYVISKKIDGGTTVAGTMILAHMAGIFVFASGGIGGVHRGAETTMDISADLMELSRTPLTVVSAGVKSILDIKLTLEYLETVGVCVATFGSSKTFPSFYTERSEFPSPCNVENAAEVAQLIKSRNNLELDSGILLAVPIPEKYKEDGEKAHSVIEAALEEAKNKEIVGKYITPFVLDQVRLLSEGASLRANIGLLENNVYVGSQVAVELSKIIGGDRSGPLFPLLRPVRHEVSNVISSSKPSVGKSLTSKRNNIDYQDPIL